jgi:Tfp pilus assembly protein FimT
MSCRHRPSAGITLIELLIVLVVMAIVAGVVLPMSQPSAYDQLHGAARILATDLAYARNLAVAGGSRYQVTFDPANNRYVLEHSGTDSSLDTLPGALYGDRDDTSTQHITNVGELSPMGGSVKLAAAAQSGTTMEPTDHVEFGPLGETTSSVPTVVWLSVGEGAAERFLSLTINPVTGISAIGEYSGEEPPADAIDGG